MIGTHLEKRLARGDPGINQLDAACKQHDIAYAKHKDSDYRYIADGKLQELAMKRVFSKDASLGERATALAVSAAMKAKRTLSKIGKGFKKKKSRSITFGKLIKDARIAIKKSKPASIQAAIKVAVKSVQKSKKGKCVKHPRTLKLPTVTGGVLPLIPIFAGLSALGSIVGSTSGIIRAINEYKDAQNQLEESKRHNRKIEAIAIGKGFYLHPNKNGNGFYLKPHLKND